MIKLLALLIGCICSFSAGEIRANEDKGVVEINLTYRCYDGEKTTLYPVTYNLPYFIRFQDDNLIARYE